MIQDISNASIRLIYKRTMVPEFSKLLNLTDSSKFFPDALDLAKEFIPSDAKMTPDLEMNFKLFLDQKLHQHLENLRKELPENSFTYKYLALVSDFQQIQNFFTRNFGKDLKEMQMNFIELEKELLLKGIYLSSFQAEMKRLVNYKTIFEYLSHLDHIFFELLIHFAKNQTQFIRKFVAHKIDTYNLTVYSRLKNFGRTEEFIRDFLIAYPESIPKHEINETTIHKIVRQFTPQIQRLEANLIEGACLTRELNYLKKSIFEGVDEPAILFYLETIKAFFYDLKMLTLAREMNSNKDEMKALLINYSLTS